MPLDFKVTGADDGYNNEDSIQPYENGEEAEQTVFRRPPENLRTRSEVLRRAADDSFLTNSADRGWLLVATYGVNVTWNGTVAGGGGGDGKWALSGGAIYLMPINSAHEENTRNDIRARLSYKIATDKYFTVRSYSEGGDEIRAYNGANNLKIELFKVAGETFPSHTPQITVVGSEETGGTGFDPGNGPVLIRVQLSYDTQVRSTWGQVCTELNADTDAGPLIRAYVESSVSTLYAVEIAEQFLWEGVGTDVSGVGAVDAQAVGITAGEITAFFATGGGSAGMADGDSVVVEFDTARDRLDTSGDASAGAAMRLIHRDENDAADDDDTFSSVGTAFKGNSVALCKVLNNELWFVNGSVFKKDETGAIRHNDATLRAALASQTPTVGAALIGNDALVGTNLNFSAGTVNDQLDDFFAEADSIRGEYDAHVAGTADQHPDGDITSATHAQTVIASPSYPLDLPGSDLRTNLEYIADNLVTHIKKSTKSAISHMVGGIKAKPYVVVDPDYDTDQGYEGDVQSISAALDYIDYTDSPTPLKDIGGTIFIKPGTYTGSMGSLSGVDHDIHYVGMSRDAVLFNDDVVMSGTTNNANVFVENMTFQVPTNARIFNNLNPPTGYFYKFKNCRFYKSYFGAASLYELISISGGHVIFEDCMFEVNSNGWVDLNKAVRAWGDNCKVEFNNCHFKDFGVVLDSPGDGSEAYFRGCFFEKCGYTGATTSASEILIQCGVGAATPHEHFHFINNRINGDETGSGGKTNAGRWIYAMTYDGLIDGNYFKPGIPANNTYTGSFPYTDVEIFGFHNAEKCRIVNNHFDGGRRMVLRAEYSIVANNIFNAGVGLSGTSDAVIWGIECAINGNQIIMDSSGVSDFDAIFSDNDSSYTAYSPCSVANNVINNLQSGSTGIVMECYHGTCTGNTIVSDDSDTSLAKVGISVTGANCVISGNVIAYANPCIAVSVLADRATITGNYCQDTTSGVTDQGVIELAGSTCDNVSIIGNNIDANGGSEGIELNSADSICICGNRITVGTGAAINGAGSNCGTKDEAGTGYTVNNNWFV